MRSPTLDICPAAQAAVRNYARLNPHLDIRDLAQEAALQALSGCSDWTGIALLRVVAEQCSPVSLPNRRGRKGSRDRANWERAANARRAPLTVRLGHGSEIEHPGGEIEHPGVAQVAADSWEPLEDQLDRARALAVAVAVLEARSEAARAVVLEGEKPAVVAERLGMDVRQVYVQRDTAMRAIRAELAPMVEEGK